MCLSFPHLSQSLYNQTLLCVSRSGGRGMPFRKALLHRCPQVTPKEEADKSNLAVGPAISAALRQIVFAEELQQMKLHSVLSSYRSFQWEKQNILEALTLCKHERLTGKNKAT